ILRRGILTMKTSMGNLIFPLSSCSMEVRHGFFATRQPRDARLAHREARAAYIRCATRAARNMNVTLTARRSPVRIPWFESFARRHRPWWRTAVFLTYLTVMFGILALADERTFNGVS